MHACCASWVTEVWRALVFVRHKALLPVDIWHAEPQASRVRTATFCCIVHRAPR